MAGRRLRLGLALVLGAVAFRSLFGLDAGLHALTPAAALGGDDLFFGAHELSPWLVVALSAWLLWRRLPDCLALPDQRGLGALALLVPGAACLAWSQLAAAPDLQLVSLAALLLGLAWHAKGVAGARQVALPALLLLFALPIPAPLENELLWWLQILTTWTSVSLLDLVGYQDVYGSGILIHLDGRHFQVIEACSGLRGIQILTLVSLAIRELLRDGGPRMWGLVACAPLVGFVANALRVSFIAVGSPELAPGSPAEQDHTGQGLAVVVGGTVFLYALGRLLERRSGAATPQLALTRLPAPGRVSFVWLVLLAGLSWLPDLELHAASPAQPAAIPERLKGWLGEGRVPDRLYLGELPLSSIIERRYTRRGQPKAPPVELFIGYQDVRRPRDSLLAGKLGVPGRDWSPNGSRVERLWVLDRDVAQVLAARPFEQAISYVWHTRDHSWLEASLRSLLALPLARGQRAYDVVVRISTPLARVGPMARSRAKQRLDAFAKDFREPLSALSAK